MKDRIKIIRQTAKTATGIGMTRKEFAENIHVTENFIYLLETGRSKISDRTITDICSVYNINKEWLLTGDGEMFRKRTKNQEIAEFLADVTELSDDDFKKKFIEALAEMDDAGWTAVGKFIDKLTKK